MSRHSSTTRSWRTSKHEHRGLGRQRARLNLERLEERALMATFPVAPGVGWEGQGADMAFVDLNRNGIADMIAMAYDAPGGANTFRYRIGYDVDATGRATSWSGVLNGPSVGSEGQGASLAVVNLDGDSQLDVIFMAYDNPVGANSFRYVVGYDMSATGAVSSWSGMRSTSGFGHEGAGAGLAIGNFDTNPRPDALFMAYDDPGGQNQFRYKIGYNLDVNGVPQSYGSEIRVDGVGCEADGAGVELGNFDSNPLPDAIFMAYDDPAGANTFRFKIAYNLASTGKAQSWSKQYEVAGLGTAADGAGIALHDVDRDGAVEFVFMAYDDVPNANTFRFMVHEAETTARVSGGRLTIDVGVCGGNTGVASLFGSTLIVAADSLSGVRKTFVYPATGITAITVNGSEAADQISSQTGLPCVLNGNGLHDTLTGGSVSDQLYGGEGNDTLFGGSGADRLYGGNGNDELSGDADGDFLYGGAGNDRLWGGSGIDSLYGEAGNDGLFGGVGSRDLLDGGAGADRILEFGGEESIFGLEAGVDAQIRFNHGDLRFVALFGELQAYSSATWTDAEIKQIDQAFAYLHEKAGNTRLLRLGETGVLNYTRQGVRLVGTKQTAGGWNEGLGRQFITAYDIDRADVTAIHEIAHNWDEPEESTFNSLTKSTYVDVFRDVSDWRTTAASTHTLSGDGNWYWLTSSAGTFARTYGAWNPLEDWATTWEAVYARDRGQTTGYTVDPDKTAIVDDFFASLV